MDQLQLNAVVKMETIDEESEAAASNRNMKNEVKELFQLCDRDKKGYATASDLEQLKHDLGLTTEQIKVVFTQLDKDGDGLVTPEEFEVGLELYLQESAAAHSAIGKAKQIPQSSEDYDPDCSSPGTSPAVDEGRSSLLEPKNVQRRFSNGEIPGSLQDSAAIHLWSQLQQENPDMLPVLEEFFQNLASEHQKIKDETSTLQQSFQRKTQAYEQQVRVLYEEMESQIQGERERIVNKKTELEKELRRELDLAVETKDKDIQVLLEKWLHATKQLEVASETKTVTENENQKLQHEKELLEHQLHEYQAQLNELHQQLDEVKAKSVHQKRERFRSAFQLSEKIAWERQSLVRQLDLLRSINKRLLDDKDELEQFDFVKIESVDDVFSVGSPELTEMKSAKRGSVMSDYFGIESSEVNNNGNSSAMATNVLLPISNEPSPSVSPVPGRSTNPFLSSADDQDTNFRRSSKTGGFPLCFSSTNPFFNFSKEKDSKENEYTYTSFVDADFDAIDSVVVFDASNECGKSAAIQIDPNGATDSKAPVYCLVHPNNHQRNGNFARAKLVVEGLMGSEEEKRNGSDDGNLMSFEEMASEAVESEVIQSPSSSETTEILLNPAANAQVPQSVFKVIFIGDSGVGKTSLISRICGGNFNDKFCTTIGVDFRVRTVPVDGHQVVLQMWDTAGQERFRSITSQYMRRSDGVLIVYDVNSEISFRNVSGWMSSIESVNNENVVVALIGNKLDLCRTIGKKAIPTEDGKLLAEGRSALFLETSAKENLGIEELVFLLARNLQKKQHEDMEKSVKLTSVASTPTGGTVKRKCC